MFKKNQCKKCKKKINSNYDFCPYCGTSLNENSKENWGMLGRSDELNSFSNPMFGNNMLNKMLAGAMKMLQKEMQKGMKGNNLKPRTNFRLMINGKEVNLNQVPNKNKSKPVKKVVKAIQLPSNFSEENHKKFLSLPREEPSTNVRRLSDKVIYEIELKSVKSINDVAIIKLENSIEIKAVSKDKSYFKVIPLNLPITHYELLDENLVLEFEAK